jgi:uncharacterized protein DUF6010
VADGYRTLGFIVIVLLYLVVGVMAAVGTISIFRKMLGPRSEQIFYAAFLAFIAALYLAFVAYFGAVSAWPLEATVVAGFVAISLLGLRVPFALIVGYSLHGLWDLFHELHAHGGYFGTGNDHLTAIPLAYGFFCLGFDFTAAGYFFRRRADWIASWKAVPE